MFLISDTYRLTHGTISSPDANSTNSRARDRGPPLGLYFQSKAGTIRQPDGSSARTRSPATSRTLRAKTPYSYVYNTPTVRTDPAGLAPVYTRACQVEYCHSTSSTPDLGFGAIFVLTGTEFHHFSQGTLPSLAGRGEPLFCIDCKAIRTIRDEPESPATAGIGSSSRGRTAPTGRPSEQDVFQGMSTGRVAVIGEDMEGRVKPFAGKYGYETMPDLPRTLSGEQTLRSNRAWINARMDEGYTIIDLAPARSKADYP